MHLVIISHTEHYQTSEGNWVGWGPTVTELNHLAAVFDRITHVAMASKDAPPASALPYSSNAIQFVPLPRLGGPSLIDKLMHLWYAPRVLRTVGRQLKQADVFQFRAPTGIGVYLIPYLILCTRKKGWFKYAGNWKQASPPLGYRWQRWLLKHQGRTVTINGHWPHQPQHCLSFENPCLTDAELQAGTEVVSQKDFEGALELCYVGRLETPKGVGRILEALGQLPARVTDQIKLVHLVGEGAERAQFEAQAQKLTRCKVRFHGALPRSEVFELYKRCHLFVMPTTASEGFPKVLAEAYNFGCIPVVSNISAIGHYIKDGEHGYVLAHPTANALAQRLEAIITNQRNEIASLLIKRATFVRQFGFEQYNDRIANAILNTEA